MNNLERSHFKHSIIRIADNKYFVFVSAAAVDAFISMTCDAGFRLARFGPPETSTIRAIQTFRRQFRRIFTCAPIDRCSFRLMILPVLGIDADGAQCRGMIGTIRGRQ